MRFFILLVRFNVMAAVVLAGHSKRQTVANFSGVVNAGYGKVLDPAGATSRQVEMPSRWSHILASKTVKLRYGPYNVPNMTRENILGHSGALFNYPDLDVEKPCERCVMIGINAGLEYADGTNANVDTGMWLHHYVHLVIGPGRQDPTCESNPNSLPHLLVGSTPSQSERIFFSGNERTIAPSWQSPIENAGYHLKPTDKFALIVDIMNDSMEDRVVYLTVTYDYVVDSLTKFDDIKPIWLDVEQCGTSEVEPPQETGAFTITAKPWTANFDGEVIGAAGHLHDGGDRVHIMADEQLACSSEASYGATSEFISTAPMGSSNSATAHISNMSLCVGSTMLIRKFAKGQNWTIQAHYNYDKAKGMLHHNKKQENIMGLAILYVKRQLYQTAPL